MAHYVVYLPGVNDHKNAQLQINALQRWKKFKLEPYFHLINWHSPEPYKLKLSKVLKIVDGLLSQNQTVSLVGASAGASMAINIFAKRKDKINAVVLICAKVNNPQTLGDNYKTNNPALFDSVSASAASIRAFTKADKKKILTIRPFFDGTVAASDSIVKGAKNKRIISFIHAPSIYLAITLYRRKSINFLKKKAIQ